MYMDPATGVRVSDGMSDQRPIVWLHLPGDNTTSVPGLVRLTLEQVRAVHDGLTKFLEAIPPKDGG